MMNLKMRVSFPIIHWDEKRQSVRRTTIALSLEETVQAVMQHVGFQFCRAWYETGLCQEQNLVALITHQVFTALLHTVVQFH